MAEARIVTVDNGGTDTRVARGGGLIDPDSIRRYKTPQNYDRAIGRLAANVRHVNGGKRPDVLGIGVAGQIENGRIVKAGQLAAYKWTHRPFAVDVAAELGVPLDRVVTLGDCDAGANAERVARRPREGELGAFLVVSTGFGGSPYTSEGPIHDEPGHEYLKAGAVCGCGQEGCMEAHISGSGMERKFGLPDELTDGDPFLHNDDPRWAEVRNDFHTSMDLTLARYEAELGSVPSVVAFTGSVALKGPDLLTGLQQHLDARMGGVAPRIEEAVYGDLSGLYGASFAAEERLLVAA